MIGSPHTIQCSTLCGKPDSSEIGPRYMETPFPPALPFGMGEAIFQNVCVLSCRTARHNPAPRALRVPYELPI